MAWCLVNFTYFCLIYLNTCPSQSLIPNGLFHFLTIQGHGRETPWRCARNIFQGSQGLKLSFQGSQGKFSRGIIPVRPSLPVGSYLVFVWAIFGITPWNSSPKANFCLPHCCMDKKWNSPISFLASIQGPQCDNLYNHQTVQITLNFALLASYSCDLCTFVSIFVFSQKLKGKAFLWAFVQVGITYNNNMAVFLTLNVQKTLE